MATVCVEPRLLTFTPHEKLSIKRYPNLNEAWLHDRICEDPTILGLGDVRVLDRERTLSGGGRLDLLLLDEDNNRRFEVEIMLGATDPSHIIRTIEYWDLERRRYPGYDHIAVLVAEDVTARFLNVMGLFAGSIPLVAIQLDALRVEDKVLLNFVQVLDQSELRVDDSDDEESGGGEVDRSYWNNQAGPDLMHLCEEVVSMINEFASRPQEMNFLRQYIGLRSNGVVKNFVYMSPKRTKRLVHLSFRNESSDDWKSRFEEAGVPVQSRRKGKFKISIGPRDLATHRDLVREAIADTVRELGI